MISMSLAACMGNTVCSTPVNGTLTILTDGQECMSMCIVTN